MAQSLPSALHQLRHDIRLVMPAYPQAKQQLKNITRKVKLNISDLETEILESSLPNTNIPLLLIDCPSLFNREGNPYTDEQGHPWPDNAQRFAQFCRAIVSIAIDQAQLDWQPDILHCNDWHTGLSGALLSLEQQRPRIIFTIHNLAYQGLFPHETFVDLKLPEELWSYDKVEFNGQLSFIKAGIVYADHVNTVSPTYAKEIQTAEYGAGLDTLLTYHSAKLSGIINGINLQEWNPETDKHIHQNYTAKNIQEKRKNKLSLQKQLNLPIDANIPLFSVISRIAEQKGIDLIISILSNIVENNTQIVLLGAGDKSLETQIVSLAQQSPNHIAANIGYDEALAHTITAAADFFLMPSRYEPCGLNQMYSQRYGTIPIVRNTGGLADTVINYAKTMDHTASTGIAFDEGNKDELLHAINTALELYSNQDLFKQVQLNAMQQDFSWQKSALEYTKIYMDS